jgi:hypothetical protein
MLESRTCLPMDSMLEYFPEAVQVLACDFGAPTPTYKVFQSLRNGPRLLQSCDSGVHKRDCLPSWLPAPSFVTRLRTVAGSTTIRPVLYLQGPLFAPVTLLIGPD